MEKIYHSSWTADARKVCDRALERHGGWQNWQAFESVRLKPKFLAGTVPHLKGYPGTFTLPEFFEIFPHERKTVFHGFPRPGRMAIYANGNLEIPLAEGNNFVLDGARRRYHGLKKWSRWQDRDSLYFFGYAWVGYLSVPFILPSFQFVKHSTYQRKDETWDVITVDFPSDFETHCTRQSFYFDPSGLLRRNDYHAEIIGRWAMGAHYSFEYELVNGIEVALQRRVYMRLGNVVLPKLALSADLTVVI
jgi:hypothetical protein